MQIGISMGTPGAAHICMPTLRLGRGALDAHKEKADSGGWLVSWTAPLPPSALGHKCALLLRGWWWWLGGGEGRGGHKERESEGTER